MSVEHPEESVLPASSSRTENAPEPRGVPDGRGDDPVESVELIAGDVESTGRPSRAADRRGVGGPQIDWREERRGTLPGNRYVRVLRSQDRGFTAIAPSHLRAGEIWKRVCQAERRLFHARREVERLLASCGSIAGRHPSCGFHRGIALISPGPPGAYAASEVETTICPACNAASAVLPRRTHRGDTPRAPAARRRRRMESAASWAPARCCALRRRT